MSLSTIAAGAVGSGVVAAVPAFSPNASPPTPSLPLPPSPADMPELWDSIKFGSLLGDLTFGPLYGDEGKIEVDLESSIKTDKQKSAGKSKSKTKVSGKDDVKGKIVITWTAASWERGCRFTMQLDPQGPLGGTPLTTDHPEFQRRMGGPTLGQSATAQPIKIMIKKAGKFKKSGGQGPYVQEFDVEEWVPPDDKAGTTDTPGDKTHPGSQYYSVNGTTEAAGQAAAVAAQFTGKGAFGGAAAPKASP